jgi:nitronate monooxygenase
MKTKLCQMLGIEHPIIAAPMGPDLTGPDLVAAVSNAGGLGILQAQFCTPPVFRQGSGNRDANSSTLPLLAKS